jgi:hypothetical protein
MFDDNGTMRFVEYTSEDRERQTAFIQTMVDAVRQHCVMVPAYGPEELPADQERAQDVLEDEEHAALLLTSERNATLFTVDGRLAQFAFVAAKLKSVWPQEVLRFAAERGKRYPKHSITQFASSPWTGSTFAPGIKLGVMIPSLGAHR